MYPSLLQRLKTQHEVIPELIVGLNDKKLVHSPLPGKWSIKDNITHLAKYQPVFLERINKILKEENPSFPRYNANEDPEFSLWQMKPTHELLNVLKLDREKIVKFYSTLEPDALKRCGLHLKFGKLSMINWLEFFILHEAHHLFTIFQLVHDQETVNTDLK